MVDDVWVHDSTNQQVKWFSPKLHCHCLINDILVECNSNGDAMRFYIGSSRYALGRWCDYGSSHSYNYICKSTMSPNKN